MDEHRLKHALSVARKMVEIADKINLNENEKEICFLIGYNHDIGYEFTDEEINHNKVGGEILKKTGFKYWREIYYHGESDTEFTSTYLNILNQADMQIDRYGNDVGYDKRLEDIRNRYGKNSIIYKKCCRKIKGDIVLINIL